MDAKKEARQVTPAEFRKLFEGLPQPQPTMRDVASGFGTLLQKLRVRSGLSLRDLEQLSGVPNPVISAIEHGRRKCGARVAKQLAEALFDVGQQENQREFLYAAAATIKARGVIEDAQLYPPAVLDLVPSLLRAKGIRDRDILAAHREPRNENENNPDMLIVLHRGRRVQIRVTFKEVKLR